MKSLVLLFLLIAGSASAQSIQLTPLTTNLFCMGDTITLQYSTKGSFKADNIFIFQLSSVDDSFTSFINLGTSKALSGSMRIALTDTGKRFPFRVVATDPSTSSNWIGVGSVVYSYPNPSLKVQYYGYERQYNESPVVGVIGDTITVSDNTKESPGSSFTWKFGQDANVKIANTKSAEVIYPVAGVKYDTLTVQSPGGCAKTAILSYEIESCMQVIPAKPHIVTGSDTGSYPNVWVKTGGNYEAIGGSGRQNIFVESGASVVIYGLRYGVIYIKNGGSLSMNPDPMYGSEASTILGRGVTIKQVGESLIDMYYCDNIDFDTTQVHSGVSAARPLTVTINQFRDHIEVNGLIGEANSITIFNLLGREVYSKPRTLVANERIDTRSLTTGVYYVRVETADGVLTKGISVVR